MKAFRKFLTGARLFRKKAKKNFSLTKNKVLAYVDKNPNRSFYIALGILFVLIVFSNILGTPRQKVEKPANALKQVEIYTIGSVPKLDFSAQIEKSQVVTITSLAPGVVQSINKPVGSTVKKGEALITLSSNYQGGNASSLSRVLAQKQYQSAVDNNGLQKDIIAKQKEIAQKAEANADEIRDITEKSIDETNGLIDLNSDIISSLDQNISNLESTNVSGANDSLILQTKQLKSQYFAGLNAARQALRMVEYNADNENPPAELSDLQKDVTIKQLELQEKMLDLNREIAGFQLKIARTVEAMMIPAAPFYGSVERIFVKIGQSVNPGTPLAVLSGDRQKAVVTAVAYIPQEIANKISKLEESVVRLSSGDSFKAQPVYISKDTVNGSLSAVYFNIPDKFYDKVTEKGYVNVALPIGYFDSGTTIPYIPIDAVYQTNDKNYVFTEKDGIAESTLVELGDVFGSFVEIKKGLNTGDKVIKNRNIISGDHVSVNTK